MNEKIVEVKDIAENKLTKMKIVAEAMQQKMNAYRQLDSKLHMLMEFDVKDIVSALPKIKPLASDVFHLFVKAYGEAALLPLIGKTFGVQLGADKGALTKQIEELKAKTIIHVEEIGQLSHNALKESHLRI